jgi:hypothetical protein
MLPVYGQSCNAASELCKQQWELAVEPAWELAMERAMRARSVRATEHATNVLWPEVDHAMLRAAQAAVGAGDGASDAGTVCARY